MANITTPEGLASKRPPLRLPQILQVWVGMC